MKRLLAIFALVSMSAFGQVPDAPEPQNKFDKLEWTLLASDAAARGLDVYSTRWALNAGNKEAILPSWIVNHTSVMALYSGGIVAAQYFVARKLFPRHRKIAHLITAIDVSVTSPFAVHNLLLPECNAPKVYTKQGCQVPVSVGRHR
jgi:hypothetical protein